MVRAPTPVHGKLSAIRHSGAGLFRGINASFQATRYHSLVVERASLPEELTVTADTEDGLIMGLAHHACRCTACNSIPKASPPSTATCC